MTVDEMKKVLSILSTAYPKYYATMDSNEKWNQVNLYMDMFGKYPFDLVANALKNYIKVNEYPPTIAGLNKEVERMRSTVGGTTMDDYIKEAWSAVQGNKRYEELSVPVKKYFGSQQVIDSIGLDENTIYTVFVGQMQRRLPDILENVKAEKEMTPYIKETVKETLSEEELIRIEEPKPVALPEAEERVKPSIEMIQDFIKQYGYNPLGKKGE